MRFDRECGETAGDIVNDWDEQMLSRVFREYGGVQDAGDLRKRLCSVVRKSDLKQRLGLRSLYNRFLEIEHLIHPATKVFQALPHCGESRARSRLKNFTETQLVSLKTGAG